MSGRRNFSFCERFVDAISVSFSLSYASERKELPDYHLINLLHFNIKAGSGCGDRIIVAEENSNGVVSNVALSNT